MAAITVSLFLIFKIFCAFCAEGFLAMLCLWPINDKPTSKGQFITFGILSLIFLGWFFNWYSINFTLT